MTIADHKSVKQTLEISCFISELMPGGAQRAAVKLVNGFAEHGLRVDLVLADKQGPYLDHVDKTVRVIDLAAGRIVKAIRPLAGYLMRERPRALVSFLSHANIAAVAACMTARVDTRLAVVEQNTVTEFHSNRKRDSLLPALVRRTYPRADDIIAVSEGAAADLMTNLNIAAEKVTVIPNPVVDDHISRLALQPPRHPWFENGSTPVFVAVGRLDQQKDFVTLLHAFELLRQSTAARLVIMGEGRERPHLQSIIGQLKLTDHVALPGFTANPYSLMARASAFVLSSRWEGLPTALIEAMACGCPVVATNCPNGPHEILDGGRFGQLVPPGDTSALYHAMKQVLHQQPAASVLKERARKYSVNRAVESYLNVLGLDVKELAIPA